MKAINLKRMVAIFLFIIFSTSIGGMPMNVWSENEDALYDSFKTPEDRKKPAPLWFWNRQVEDMTVEKVREIVRESYLQSGYGGIAILPEWQTAYLTEEYFELYEAALDEGKKYGMKFVLYNENGWPTYDAGGLLEEQYPELTAKRLDMISADAADGQTVNLELPEGQLMGAVAMNTDTFERVDISDQAVILPPEPLDLDSVPAGLTASSTYSSPGYEADKAADGDLSTRWNAAAQSGGKQYLQIKYPEPVTIDTVKVYEDADPSLWRTARYYIQYWDDAAKKWVNAAEGLKITSAGAIHTFAPVTTQIVRLYISRITSNSATISEFEVWSGGQKLPVPPTEIINAPGVSGSSSYSADYDAKFAFDGNMSTRWNADRLAQAPHWLEMDFGSKRTVDSVKMYQNLARISGFQIQYWDGAAWQTCYTGTAIAEPPTGSTFTFPPVETTAMRLYITQSEMNATLWEIEFYNGAEKLCPDSVTPKETSRLTYTVPSEGNYKVMAFVCVKDGIAGMDYLDEEAVAAFIHITYDAYYDRFKSYFDDGTITAAFYDEPTFYPHVGRVLKGVQGARFWTPGFNEDYEAYYGESPVLDYPAMFMDIGGATASARNRLHTVRTELFAHNFIGQMNRWCDDHGIGQTGHMLFEEQVNPVGLHGDLMKAFKEQDIPGVDVIESYGHSQEAYKIISSSANNWDKSLVMSESFGVFNDTTMTDFYKTSMDLFAKGINFIVPHAIWYDDDPKEVSYVPELSYRSPTFGPNLPALNDYIGRSQTMLQNGRHVADIGLLYPIDTLESEYIFNGQYNAPSYADYMNVGEILSLTARRDFTYLHPEVLDGNVTLEGDTLKLNNTTNYEQYKVMVISGMKVISLSNLQKIKAFYDAGGKVIATTQLPYLATNEADNTQVKSIMQEIFGVDPENLPAPVGPTYRSSSDYGKTYSAAMAFDGEYGENSRWNAGGNGAGQWIEVVFPQPTTVNKTDISEMYGRVTGYRIEYYDDATSTYKTAASGTTIGTHKVDTFTPVTTTRLRLYLTGVSVNSVSIDEFEVYNGQSENLAVNNIGLRFTNTNQNGGKSWFIDSNLAKNLPAAIDEAQDLYDVEIADPGTLSNGYLSYIHKVKDGRDIYFFANSSGNAVSTAVLIRGHLNAPMLWNPYDGSRENADYAYKTVGGAPVTEVTLKLSAVNSVYLVESLPEPPDKSFLKDAVEQGDAISGKLDEYADGPSKTAFSEALAEAKRVYSDLNAVQEEIDKAKSDLLSAIDALRQKADKSSLKKIVDDAKKIGQTKYTEASLAVFISALANAEEILADQSLSSDDQNRVDEAAAELQAAISGLKLMGGDDSSDPDSSASDSSPASSSEPLSSADSSDHPVSQSGDSSDHHASSDSFYDTASDISPGTGDSAYIFPAFCMGIVSLAAVWMARRKARRNMDEDRTA